MVGMQSKAERLEMIKAAAKRFQKLKAQEARFVREEKRKVEPDERYWTDASSYAEQYYGETFRATTRFDNDWD
jgi:hypothetical protein